MAGHIDLAQLRDNLFRLVTLPGHFGPPLCPKTYLGMDHSVGVDHRSRSVHPQFGQAKRSTPTVSYQTRGCGATDRGENA